MPKRIIIVIIYLFSLFSNAKPSIAETPLIPTTLHYLYDGDGVLVAKSENGKITYYINDSYEKEKETGKITKYYTFAKRKIAQRVNDNLSFLTSDQILSISQVIDINGSKQGEIQYYPYGSIRWENGSTPTRLFTGQRKDSASGLYNYNARYYNPETGLFITPDQKDDPLNNGNKFMYVAGNPLRYTDPTGNELTDDMGQTSSDEKDLEILTSMLDELKTEMKMKEREPEREQTEIDAMRASGPEQMGKDELRGPGGPKSREKDGKEGDTVYYNVTLDTLATKILLGGGTAPEGFMTGGAPPVYHEEMGIGGPPSTRNGEGMGGLGMGDLGINGGNGSNRQQLNQLYQEAIRKGIKIDPTTQTKIQTALFGNSQPIY